jgi:hypothetical protein
MQGRKVFKKNHENALSLHLRMRVISAYLIQAKRLPVNIQGKIIDANLRKNVCHAACSFLAQPQAEVHSWMSNLL